MNRTCTTNSDSSFVIKEGGTKNKSMSRGKNVSFVLLWFSSSLLIIVPIVPFYLSRSVPIFLFEIFANFIYLYVYWNRYCMLGFSFLIACYSILKCSSFLKRCFEFLFMPVFSFCFCCKCNKSVVSWQKFLMW